jgi:SAM-dependent methyltransferase
MMAPRQETVQTMRDWNQCPVCLSEQSKTDFIHRPSKFIPGIVVSCAGCGMRYKTPDNADIAACYNDSYAELFTTDDAAATKVEFDAVFTSLAALGVTGGKMMEVGCGAGDFLVMARERGFTVSGVELTPPLAAAARQKLGDVVQTGDAMTLDLPAHESDVVVMLDVIEHVQDPAALLARLRGALKPEGKLVVFTPNHASLICHVAEALSFVSVGRVSGPLREIYDSMHVSFFDCGSLQTTFEKAGFDVKQTHMIGYEPERRGSAKGATALILRGIEAAAALLPRGRFRVLMTGTPHAAS